MPSDKVITMRLSLRPTKHLQANMEDVLTLQQSMRLLLSLLGRNLIGVTLYWKGVEATCSESQKRIDHTMHCNTHFYVRKVRMWHSKKWPSLTSLLLLPFSLCIFYLIKLYNNYDYCIYVLIIWCYWQSMCYRQLSKLIKLLWYDSFLFDGYLVQVYISILKINCIDIIPIQYSNYPWGLGLE